jgi:hypothetical protein
MTEKVQREFRLEEEDAAELLRDIADALENEEQLNIDLGDSRLMQPLGGKTPLRIYQDDEGTEIGFRLRKEE